MALIKKGERNQLKDGHMQVKTVKSISVKLGFMSGNKYTISNIAKYAAATIAVTWYPTSFCSPIMLISSMYQKEIP
jgi:hypothetical protein